MMIELAEKPAKGPSGLGSGHTADINRVLAQKSRRDAPAAQHVPLKSYAPPAIHSLIQRCRFTKWTPNFI
jgi:hypothetical protein